MLMLVMQMNSPSLQGFSTAQKKPYYPQDDNEDHIRKQQVTWEASLTINNRRMLIKLKFSCKFCFLIAVCSL